MRAYTQLGIFSSLWTEDSAFERVLRDRGVTLTVTGQHQIHLEPPVDFRIEIVVKLTS